MIAQRLDHFLFVVCKVGGCHLGGFMVILVRSF
jgi:hypothetical protein